MTNENKDEYRPILKSLASKVMDLIDLEKERGRVIKTLYISASFCINLSAENLKAKLDLMPFDASTEDLMSLAGKRTGPDSIYGIEIIEVHGQPDGYIDYSINHGNSQLAL